MDKGETSQPNFGAMAWANAVKRATSWGNKKIEKSFLKPLIDHPDHKDWQPPNNFTKYLQGKTSPIRSSGQGGLNFVDRVEFAHPGTKYWLDLVLWNFVFESDLQLRFIWEKMAECKIANPTSFFEFNSRGYPLRTASINRVKLRSLAQSDNVIEALTFLMGLLREAEIRIDVRTHYQVATTIKSLIPRLNEVPEFKTFLGALLDYIEVKFMRVIYTIPDSGSEIVYPTSWREIYPDISKVAIGVFPLQADSSMSKDVSPIVNDPNSYRSLYGVPSENPIQPINITDDCIRDIRKLERHFA